MAFALGTLKMDPEVFLWSTWREINAMVRGHERAHRDAWERTLMLFNVQVERAHRLTYDRLFAKNRPRQTLEYSQEEWERRQARNEEARERLKQIFGEEVDGV